MKAPSPDTCLGMLEAATVPAGMRAMDAMVKEAEVVVLDARPLTPAKYIVVIEGDVESVRRSIDSGRRVAAHHFMGEVFLPKPHERLLAWFKKHTSPKESDAVGVLETASVHAAVAAIDAALKRGDVHVLDLRLAMGLGGRAFLAVTGEVSSVEAAMEAADAVARTCGDFVDAMIVARPDAVSWNWWRADASPFRDFDRG